MVRILNFMVLMIAANLIKTKNPIKIRIFLTLIRIALFSFLSLNKGSCWISIIFYILFIGGILVIFIILSSLSPNESSLKIKTSRTILIILALMKIQAIKMQPIEIIQALIKNSLRNWPIIIIVRSLIIIFFFSFLMILSREKTSIRSTICHKVVIL